MRGLGTLLYFVLGFGFGPVLPAETNQPAAVTAPATLSANTSLAPAIGNVTFLVTSDAHYDAYENEDRNERIRDTLRYMNLITNVAWLEELGGGFIARPRGVLVLGDMVDDGDRVLQGHHQTPKQWEFFVTDFGLDGSEGLLKFPVYETWGNHDGPPEGKEKNGFSVQAHLKERNRARLQKGWLAELSTNQLHYSWDWAGIHFVQMGIYPADRQNPLLKRYSPVWHDPQNALAFLKQDLARHVGGSRRPVVLMSHCGFDTDFWHTNDWRAFYEVVREYNVLLYFYGHTGTGVKTWPPGGDPPLNCVNTGQTENGFFVVQITGTRLRLAYRVKHHWLVEKWTNPNRKRTWDGEWEWRFPFQKEIKTAK